MIYSIIADQNCYNIVQLKEALVTDIVCIGHIPPRRLLLKRLRRCPIRLPINAIENYPNNNVLFFSFHYDGHHRISLFEQSLEESPIGSICSFAFKNSFMDFYI